MKILNVNDRLRLQKVVRSLVLGIVLVTAAATSAHADARHDGGRNGGAGDRDWRAHERRQVHGYEPGVVYAPPVVYTPPQYQEPGINLIVPLNFR